jgi:hypothetical protein
MSYCRYGGGRAYGRHSKGDMRRLREWVKNAYDDVVPISLFIPFEKAWPAVKEFIETDGTLPKSIEWIGDRDLPLETWAGE